MQVVPQNSLPSVSLSPDSLPLLVAARNVAWVEVAAWASGISCARRNAEVSLQEDEMQNYAKPAANSTSWDSGLKAQRLGKVLHGRSFLRRQWHLLRAPFFEVAPVEFASLKTPSTARTVAS